VPDDGALAFELAAAARPHLSRADADRIYIAIGVGETYAAIAALLAVIARNQIRLGEDLGAVLAGWLDCYRGQDAQPRLRKLLAEVKHSSSQPMPAFQDGSPSSAWLNRHRPSG
jgi:hypothetical protein